MSHLTQKLKIFFGLLMLVVKWESLLKRRIFGKLKNAQNQVARFTPKWPNGKLSLQLGNNTDVIDWFSLKNQKLIGGKNFGATLTEGG